MAIKLSFDVIAKKPSLAQHEYYCPFDKSIMYYLYKDNILFGLCSDRWFYCNKCKSMFILSNSHGFHQETLDDVKIIMEK